MPTKKKRVGFIPREEVMKIIDRLSTENNLSNSKVISILVEEALSRRGIFNIMNSKIKYSYQGVSDNSNNFSEDSSDFTDNDLFSINTKYSKHHNPRKTTFLKQTNPEAIDLQTYKKFLSFLRFQEMMDEYNA